MYRIKSTPGTPGTRRRTRRNAIAPAGFLALLLIGCGGGGNKPASPGMSLRVAHLTDYAWRDRSGTGQPADLKPESERNALLQDLGAAPADLLILRGLGSEPALRHLRDALRRHTGLDYHAFYLPGPSVYAGAGFLTRLPATESETLHRERYEVEGRRFQPLAGAIRVEPEGTEPLWIWNAVLPEPDADYERRRNEARLLAQALRPRVEAGEAVLVSLHCREEPDSPMRRMLREVGLEPLPAADPLGDSWTHRDPDGTLYRQDQLLLASPGFRKRLAGPAQILDSPELRAAGEFRHQILHLN